jgi:cold shock CspA family protein
MSAEDFHSGGRHRAPAVSGKPSRPNEPRGVPTTGRITRIRVGQSDGFIRLRDDREIYFHRGDLQERASFNDLEVGDTVSFELLEDRVSGARAVKVVGPKRTR